MEAYLANIPPHVEFLSCYQQCPSRVVQAGSCYEDVSYQYIFDDSYHYHVMFLTLPGLVEAALDHMAPNCTLTFPQYLTLFHYCSSSRKVKWQKYTLLPVQRREYLRVLVGIRAGERYPRSLHV